MKKKYQAITACVFLHKGRKLLIAKRSDNSSFLPGKYELVGGHIEFGETVEEGLKREVREELHIDIRIEDSFYVFTYVSENGNKHSVEIDYFAQMIYPNQTLRLNPKEHSEYKWIGQHEVNAYFPPDDPERLAARKGFVILLRRD